MSYLSQLRTFIEAYRMGSITKAADRLHITQPAASEHIKSLEDFIEKELFISHNRGIKPTEIANDLAQSISPRLHQLETKFELIQSLITSVAGTIHLASPTEFLDAKVLPAVASLLEHDIKVRIHISDRERIYYLLDDGTLDLAITNTKPHQLSLGFAEIQQETLVLVASKDWIKRSLMPPFEPEHLLSLPIIAGDEHLPLIRQYFAEVFQMKVNVQAAVTVGDLRIVRSLVCLGQGYAVLPRYLCERELQAGTLSLLHETELNPHNSLYLVWHKGNLRHPRIVYARDRLLEILGQENEL